MLTRRSLASFLVLSLFCGSLLTSRAAAETVIKFDLAGTPGPDIEYSSSALTTLDDGDLSTAGEKTTDVKFFGFLKNDFADIPNGASLTLSGITASGDASDGDGLVSQATTGGNFLLFDDMNALLLSGNFGNGVIVGANLSPTGSFFSTTPVTFTDGLLLPKIVPDSGAISLSFTSVQTGSTTGLVVANGALLNFTASATGQIQASAVPEPSTIGMAALGTLALIRRHRKRRNAAVAA